VSGSPALAGIELNNDLIRAKTTQPVPGLCGGKVTRHPPTVLVKASGVSLRFRVIYFELKGTQRIPTYSAVAPSLEEQQASPLLRAPCRHQRHASLRHATALPIRYTPCGWAPAPPWRYGVSASLR
jgi:hypothetical protein